MDRSINDATIIKVLVRNANGIRNKTHYLEHLLITHRPVIFAITETKLDGTIKDSEISSNYTIYRADRVTPGGLGGGVLIGVSNSSSIKVKNVDIHPNGELLSLNLDHLGYSVIFGCYYRPPSNKTIDDLIEWVDGRRNANLIIAGDFNLPEIEWPSRKLRSNRDSRIHKSFLNLIDINNFSQPIYHPTHSLGNTLDLVISTVDIENVHVEPSISDHHSITCDLIFPNSNLQKADNTVPSKLFWNFNKADTRVISSECSLLTSKVMQQINNNDSVESVWLRAKEGILSIAEKAIPHNQRKIKHKHWITQTTIKTIRKRNRVFKTCNRFPNDLNKSKLAHLSKLCKKLVSDDYKAFLNSHICDKLAEGNSKPLYNFIAKKRGSNGSIKMIDGAGDSPNEMAESFAHAFTSVFSIDNNLIPTWKSPQFSPPNDPLIITYPGVGKLLASLDPKKGAGPDGLSPALLKFFAPDITVLITNVISYSVATGQVPLDWKTAKVIPIYKQKGSKTSPLNYRPISLTSIISKTVEHIISHDIHEHLSANNILNDCQHGFRAQRGCESQLLNTTTDIINNLDDRLQTDLVVLDFAKAFDVVSHSKLVFKLGKLGIRPQIVLWISNWLKGRTQYVTVNGGRSSNHLVTSGVPQGSVLGPLLFLIFINDMPNCCQDSSLRLFADDSLLFKKIINPNDNLLLQKDLDNLVHWAEDWQMRFNTSKCETMTVAKNTASTQQYTINNVNLNEIESTKYLGVIIDNKLTFSEHIGNIIKKATGILYMIMRSLKKASSRTKRIAYFTICRPVLEFSSVVWSPHHQLYINKIEAVNRRAYRWAYNKGKFDHITDLMMLNNWPTLAERRLNADRSFYLKIIDKKVAVPSSKLYSHQKSVHNTRYGPTIGRVNTDVKKFSYFNRIHRDQCHNPSLPR